MQDRTNHADLLGERAEDLDACLNCKVQSPKPGASP